MDGWIFRIYIYQQEIFRQKVLYAQLNVQGAALF